jgi:hypothetical protein
LDTAISNLDEPEKLPSLYLVMKLQVDSFAEDDLTQAEIDALGRELARLWTGQMMTKKAIVSYTSVLLNRQSWEAAWQTSQ